MSYKITNKGEWFLKNYEGKGDILKQKYQQLLTLCSYRSMTKEDFVHDLAIEFSQETEAHRETRQMFNDMIIEIDRLLIGLILVDYVEITK